MLPQQSLQPLHNPEEAPHDERLVQEALANWTPAKLALLHLSIGAAAFDLGRQAGMSDEATHEFARSMSELSQTFDPNRALRVRQFLDESIAVVNLAGAPSRVTEEPEVAEEAVAPVIDLLPRIEQNAPKTVVAKTEKATRRRSSAPKAPKQEAHPSRIRRTELVVPDWETTLIDIADPREFVRTSSKLLRDFDSNEDLKGKKRDALIRSLQGFYRHVESREGEPEYGNVSTHITSLKSQIFEIVLRQCRPNINYVCQSYGERYFANKDAFDEVALVGLHAAFSRFSTDYESEFTTYAQRTIEGEIKRYLRDDTLSKKMMGRGTSEKLIEISSYQGQGFTDEEICEKMNITDEKLRELRMLDARDGWIDYLDTPTEEGEVREYTGAHGIEDEMRSEFRVIEYSDALQRAGLDERENVILLHRFNIGQDAAGEYIQRFDIEPATQEEISKMLGISQSYLSRLVRSTLAKLQVAMRASGYGQ